MELLAVGTTSTADTAPTQLSLQTIVCFVFFQSLSLRAAPLQRGRLMNYYETCYGMQTVMRRDVAWQPAANPSNGHLRPTRPSA